MPELELGSTKIVWRVYRFQNNDSFIGFAGDFININYSALGNSTFEVNGNKQTYFEHDFWEYDKFEQADDQYRT